ncbi:MAG: glycosyltransferase family 61 protein [Selenomonadaceae bacterium]|nr:glycosyltransferase family 61 protein [Selenomonadaceae bacterium]
MSIPEEEIRKRVYAQNYEQWRDVCRVSRYSERTLKVQKLEGGILLPPILRDRAKGEYSGGACDGAFRFVAGLIRDGEEPPAGGFYGVNASYQVKDSDITDVNEDIVYGGVLINHFGHFLLECFGRMWYMLPPPPNSPRKTPADDRDAVRENGKVAFLCIMGTAAWYAPFLELLGIPRERILLVERPARFRSVTIPEEAVHSWCNYTKEYLIPYRCMAERAGSPEGVRHLLGKKIFLTRSGLSSTETVCCNDAYFERFYADKGFSVIEPENFSIAEQIAILSHAEEVACIMGSLSHWALFCKPGTKFTMLTRVNDDTLASQCLVNEASGIDWYIVDVSMNFLYAHRAYGVCLLGPTFYWKRFVLETYGAFDDDDSWKYAYHEYLLQWCDFYLGRDVQFIKKFDFYKVCQKMHQLLCQNEFSSGVPEKRLGRPCLIYCIRSQGAWELPVMEGISCNGEGDAPIEALKLFFSSSFFSIFYEVYSPACGWGGAASNGSVAEAIDSEGKAKPVFGIRMRMDDRGGEKYWLRFRVRGAGSDWSAWSHNENVILSKKPLCALEVRLLAKSGR